jgi:L-fuconolactonase
MTIDAHHHLWDPARRNYPWLAGARLAPIRRPYDINMLREHTTRTGVHQTILVQTVPDITETIEFLLLANKNRDLIAGVVGWIDLTAPAIPHELARLQATPGGDLLVGIRHQAQDEPDPNWLRRTDVVAGIRTVAATELAYDLLVLPHQLPAAIDLVTQIPTARFILDHAAKPPIATGELQPWAESIRELATAPNVAVKLSGLVTEADWQTWTANDIKPYADVILTAFGPDRIMFGSDWPVCELAATYTDVLGLAEQLLAPAPRSAVFDGTARTWYRLSPDQVMG